MALSISSHSSLAGGIQHSHLKKWDGKSVSRYNLDREELSFAPTRQKKCNNPHIRLSNKFGRIYGSRYLGVSSVSQGQEDTQMQLADDNLVEQKMSEEEEDAECVRQILRVLKLLREKRDMSFNEVRLTIMIEDPREAGRKQQLGEEDDEVCTKEDMAAALVDVNEGRMPNDRLVLQELAKEMLNWPNLEEEVEKKSNPMASPYAKVTDIGVDPKLAAQRAKIDWDAATEIIPEDEKDSTASLPPAVGFSLLYLISVIPVIIGVSVVLVLFFNSLQ